METLKHSIKIYRGESFTIDKVVQNKDGSPYIVSNRLRNPHFLLSISKSPYSNTVVNYWLSLSNFPTFDLTNPLDFNSVGGLEDATAFPATVTIDGEVVQISKDYSVYNRDATYVYWDNGWYDYECRIIKTFTTSDTSKFEPGTYYYSIQLVEGLENRAYLKELADKNGITYVDEMPSSYTPNVDGYTTNEQLYNKLLDIGVKFVENYNFNQPLGVIYNSYPILSPNEFIVTNYMQGGIL